LKSITTQKSPKLITFTPNGSHLAWIQTEGVSLIPVSEVSTGATPRQILARKNIVDIKFSPRATYISTFEKYTKFLPEEDQLWHQTNGTPVLHQNVRVYKVETGELLCSFSHKNPDTWMIQWTEDESVFGRMLGLGLDVMFYSAPNFVAGRCRISYMI
jgi:translation initiation factor 2A